MIYGAYGYTGELIATEAVAKGHRPVLAGRSPEKLEPLASSLGLEYVAISLEDSGALREALSGMDLVLNAAGPFVETSAPLVRSCLEAGAHYLDITGEIPAFQSTFSHHEEAAQKGVALMPGVGFDVVPTDCLAKHLSDAVPEAAELEIAISSITPSAGTIKSVLGMLPEGNFVRRDGTLVGQPFGGGAKKVMFPDRERTVLPIPWGDLETAYRTTGIPNITTYMALPVEVPPRVMALLMALLMPALQRAASSPALKGALHRGVEKGFKGPGADERREGKSYIWARAADDTGRQAQAWLRTAETYAFTALSSVLCVERTLQETPVGACTPAGTFGSDLVLNIEGSILRDFPRPDLL
jgi:short subunit dehydrogenase-like uncharacterized protein